MKLIIQMGILDGGSSGLNAMQPMVFNILQWANIVGWGLLLYFFIALYKKTVVAANRNRLK
jgi:hypothetical protein